MIEIYSAIAIALFCYYFDINFWVVISIIIALYLIYLYIDTQNLAGKSDGDEYKIKFLKLYEIEYGDSEELIAHKENSRKARVKGNSYRRC